ncbi:flagellar hook-length control protein FliK [Vogesella sp. LIG4]|uniref:flagellar hook-length control protein FliK n=1 Tax=Vogesella sp. LIG4 TaxID=1192162 RepID=UPI00081F9975|nr:flagellar hook-length control protein FliK [Vogesella sp. LIG4]SCK20985.1 Flagellar hook-length control protein FliK [Vogesella sp. LIG4]
MAHAITSAKGLAVTLQAASAATGNAAGAGAQPNDNSVFSQLLTQLQPLMTANGSSLPQLDSLLADGKSGAAADKLLLSSTLSGDGQGTVDAASLAQMLQSMMAAAQPATAAEDAGRQQLPAAAGIAAQLESLPLTMQQSGQAGNLLHADVKPAATEQTTVSGASGLQQALKQLADSLQAAQSGAPAATPAASSGLAAAKGKEVLPDDVRLMFRAEGRLERDDTQPLDGKLLAGQAGALAAGSASQPVQTNPATQEISQPMTRDSSAWRQAFADKVSNMVQLKLDSASIKVTPEHLGPLDISISFDSQNKAQISVVAANHAAREIVASGLPQLGKMLEQSGIQLGNVEVSSQQQFARQQDQQWQGQQQGRQRQQQRDGYTPQADDMLAGAGAVDAAAAVGTSDQLSIRA